MLAVVLARALAELLEVAQGAELVAVLAWALRRRTLRELQAWSSW
jgi:hypothetical protein